ncbi:MAG TPA: SDR family NAD(P)-dependent oxidoreductase [Sphingobium sp.]
MAQRIWFITGCSTGFGRALACQLLEHGETVVVTARRLEAIRDIVAGKEDRALALTLDVTSSESIASALGAARAQFGRIDVLVNNAGFGDMGTVEETPIEAARAMMETNYFGALAMVRGVVTEMRTRGSGQIVNIGSVAGQIGFPALAYYSASKFALAGMTEALAAELLPLGVYVTLAELGPFATDFTSTMTFNPPAAHYDMAALTRAAGNANWGAGDRPDAGAAALLAALDAPSPPVRIILGQPGLDVADLHDTRRAQERETWRSHSGLAAARAAVRAREHNAPS